MPRTIEDVSQLWDVGLEVAREFEQLELQEVMRDLAEGLVEDHAGYFAEEASPTGERWAALAASTVRKKGNSRILVDTDTLRQDLTSVVGLDPISEPGRGELFWGSDLEYSVYLQEGTDVMPARPHVGMTEGRVEQFATDVADGIVDKLKEGNR
jgi:phage gpG-like protein